MWDVMVFVINSMFFEMEVIQNACNNDFGNETAIKDSKIRMK